MYPVLVNVESIPLLDKPLGVLVLNPILPLLMKVLIDPVFLFSKAILTPSTITVGPIENGVDIFLSTTKASHEVTGATFGAHEE